MKGIPITTICFPAGVEIANNKGTDQTVRMRRVSHIKAHLSFGSYDQLVRRAKKAEASLHNCTNLPEYSMLATQSRCVGEGQTLNF